MIKKLMNIKLAAAQGCANSYYQLGTFYKEGRFVEKDYTTAERHYLKARELDHPSQRQSDEENIFKHATYNLALLYFQHHSYFNKPFQNIVELFKESPVDGHDQACIFLYRYYIKLGKKENALHYLLEAQKFGNVQLAKLVNEMR